MARINGLYVLVESEEPGFEVDVTDQPVEDEADLTDHVQRRSRTLSLTGCYAIGQNANRIREMLIQHQEQGKLVDFIGRTAFSGLITSFAPKHDKSVSGGFVFSLDLKEVRIAKPSYVGKLPPPVKAQAAPVISAGTKTKKTKKANKDKKTSTKPKNTGAKTSKKKKEPVQKVKFKKGSPWAE